MGDDPHGDGRLAGVWGVEAGDGPQAPGAQHERQHEGVRPHVWAAPLMAIICPEVLAP
jgi:hypothetical protein